MAFPESPAEDEVFAVGSRLYVWRAATGWRPAGSSGAEPDPGTLPDIYASIATRAPKDSPVFTGDVRGVTKVHVGLPKVDNTSDAEKPVSAAAQAELDKKVNSHDAEFTGTAVGLSKAMVGLSKVDNTSDLEKPVSTLTQTAIAQGLAAVTEAQMSINETKYDKEGGAINGRAFTVPHYVPFSTFPVFNAPISNVFHFGALTGTVTSSNFANGTDGQTIRVRVVQDSTGGRTFALPPNVKASGSLELGASRVTWLTLRFVALEGEWQPGRWEGSWSSVPA